MNWRTSGDTTLSAFRALLPPNSEIVKRGEVEAIFYAAQPFTRLMAGMLKAESSFATHFNSVPASMNNPLNLRRRGEPSFQSFASIADCVDEWRDRIISPTYAYRNTVTVRDLINIYAPSFENDVDKYVTTVEAVINQLPPLSAGGKESPVSAPLVFGRVPHPPFQDRPITKPEGKGQNNLGKRTPKGNVWHRMLGTLNGTDGWFRRPDVGALTDYGIGVASIDGAALDGVIYRWNDPYGYQSGWASGQVIAPYGDGLAFINKYKIDAVNRDQVSTEVSGEYDTPLTEKSRQSIAALAAYFADQYGIPWNEFPIAPQDGFSFIRWHQEFTGPQEKACPGSVIMAETPDLIERTRAIMKRWQENPEIEFPDEDPDPEPEKHTIPEGHTFESLRRLYGAFIHPTTGKEERFDLSTAPSQVWLAHGKETGLWPSAQEIIRRGNGNELYRWEGGFSWERQKG